MLNSIILMGRLTADPELKSTQTGVSVCSFNIAVERDYTGNGGDKITDFITVVAWRQTAEFICRYFNKGNMIAVQGSLESRKWKDKNGDNRVSWEVQISHAWFTGKNDNKASSAESSTYEPAALPAPGDNGTRDDFTPMDDGDLPF